MCGTEAGLSAASSSDAIIRFTSVYDSRIVTCTITVRGRCTRGWDSGFRFFVYCDCIVKLGQSLMPLFPTCRTVDWLTVMCTGEVVWVKGVAIGPLVARGQKWSGVSGVNCSALQTTWRVSSCSHAVRV